MANRWQFAYQLRNTDTAQHSTNAAIPSHRRPGAGAHAELLAVLLTKTKHSTHSTAHTPLSLTAVQAPVRTSSRWQSDSHSEDLPPPITYRWCPSTALQP